MKSFSGPTEYNTDYPFGYKYCQCANCKKHLRILHYGQMVSFINFTFCSNQCVNEFINLNKDTIELMEGVKKYEIN